MGRSSTRRALAISAEEIVDVLPELARLVADQVVQTADGCVKSSPRPSTNGDASRAQDSWRSWPMSPARANAAACNTRCRRPRARRAARPDPRARSVAARLARRRRIRAAGVGSRDPVAPAGHGRARRARAPFYRGPRDRSRQTATRLATALAERGRPLEAAGLLLDAGEPERAARMLLSLPESVTKSVEPRAMLGMLSRLGTVTDSEPGLLLLRANAAATLGRLDQVVDDVDRAAALVRARRPAGPPARSRRPSPVPSSSAGAASKRDRAGNQRVAGHRSRRGAHVRPGPRGARPGDGCE